MKVYLAGNFPQMNPRSGREEYVRNIVLNLGSNYNRLVSFYYKNESQIVFDLKEKEMQNVNSD